MGNNKIILAIFFSLVAIALGVYLLPDSSSVGQPTEQVVAPQKSRLNLIKPLKAPMIFFF